MSNTRTQRVIALSVSMVAAFALSLIAVPRAIADDNYSMRSLSGQVEIGRGEPIRWSVATAGETLRGGDRVRTGAASKAEVVWGGQTLRLYANSTVRLPRGATPAKVERGHSLIDVLKRIGGSNPFKLHTGDIVVVVRGTRFAVDLEQGAGTRVAVFEGEVALHEQSDLEAFPMSVRPGYVARMGGGSAAMISPHGLDDPWASWSESAPAAPTYGTIPSDEFDSTRSALRDAAQEQIGPDSSAPLEDAPSLVPAALDSVQDIGNPKDVLNGVLPPPADND